MVIWSLVIEKIATLEELEKSWSLDDVMRVLAILEMRSEEITEQRKVKDVNR